VPNTVNESVALRCLRITRALLVVSSAVVVMVVSSTSAQAAPITVTYSTTGAFTGCDALGGGAGFMTCTEGNSILRYDFQPLTNVDLTDAVPSASVQYGDFQMFGDSAGAGDTFAGVTFTLSVVQTSPSAGSQNLVGAVTGTVDAQSGLLIWGPVAPTSWDIGLIDWTIAVGSSTGGILINPPGALGVGGEFSTIGGTASMVPTAAPEPSTVVLMGLGLAALARRRRRRPTE
jgi:hypothetical protein